MRARLASLNGVDDVANAKRKFAIENGLTVEEVERISVNEGLAWHH